MFLLQHSIILVVIIMLQFIEKDRVMLGLAPHLLVYKKEKNNEDFENNIFNYSVCKLWVCTNHVPMGQGI